MMKWSQELMGKWVKFTHVLSRSRQGYKSISWSETPYIGEGMIIGRRWLRNGNLRHYDDFTEFIPTETVPCLAIVRNDRENHIYIPFDCCELVD